MKLKTCGLVALVIVSGWNSFCNPVIPSSGGVLEGQAVSPQQQAEIDQANSLWQRQQMLNAAASEAAQAVASAKQVAALNNDASRQAAAYAAEAANCTQQAARYYGEEFSAQLGRVKHAADAAKQAAQQAGVDSIVSKMENERDEALSQLKAKYAPTKSELEFQITALKQKALQLEAQRGQAERENAHLRAKQLFQPKDPWRTLDGKVYNAKDEAWFQFTGKVLEVRANGILVEGNFGPPLESGFGEREYFVENYPVQTYPLADGESITADMHFVAHLSEKGSVYQFTNTTIDLRAHTVRRLDYGRIVTSPPAELAQKWNNIVIVPDSNPELTKQINDNETAQTSAEEKLNQSNSDFEKEKAAIAAEYQAKIDDVPNQIAKKAKEKEDSKKQAFADGVFKHEQDLAAKGDGYGLFRMGEHYRDGKGVPMDAAKAREFFSKAAAIGWPHAAEELKKLPATGN